MNYLDKSKHEELINILEELISTIQLMRNNISDNLLYQNEEEAREWLVFLKEHSDKEELKSLENEIAEKFYNRFDIQISKDELDNKRAHLIEISECWDGIFENMTSRYCEKPSEWPVLFGIVAQNILIMFIDGGAPKDEAGMVAIESAVYMSKLDSDSVLKKE